jgi:hypothetical protein
MVAPLVLQRVPVACFTIVRKTPVPPKRRAAVWNDHVERRVSDRQIMLL